MKTVKFWDIPNSIKELEFDGDKTDLRLHFEEHYSFGAKTKAKYIKAEKEIDTFEIKGNGWIVYAGYDVSGYDYWMKNMEETNHIHIAVMFDEDRINESEIVNLHNALSDAQLKMQQIADTYNYDPSPYNV